MSFFYQISDKPSLRILIKNLKAVYIEVLIAGKENRFPDILVLGNISLQNIDKLHRKHLAFSIYLCILNKKKSGNDSNYLIY